MKTHLHRRTVPSPTYSTWLAIKKRCLNPKASGYDRYGAIGISVHPPWAKSFEVFLKDVGERPSQAHSLDRVNGAKGYDPGNVRWATPKEQSRNRSSNTMLTLNERTLTAVEWAELMGLNPTTLYMRLKNGWDVQRAITTPQAPRKARLLTLNGKTQNPRAWAAELGIAEATIYARLLKGATAAEALRQPSATA